MYCRVPNTLGTLPNLKAIVLDGNPLKSIRRDIIMVSLLLILLITSVIFLLNE